MQDVSRAWGNPRTRQTAIEFLRRHMSCDFGELENEDIQENELSLREGFRVLSAYRTFCGQRIWIITEADRQFYDNSHTRRILTNRPTRREAFALAPLLFSVYSLCANLALGFALAV